MNGWGKFGVVALSVGLVACSDSDGGGGSGSGGMSGSAAAGMPAPSGGSTSGGSGSCTDLMLSGPGVAPTQASGERPAPAGGTLSDGTYDLVEHRVYAEVTPEDAANTRQTSLLIKGGGQALELVSEATNEELDRHAFSVEVQGTTMVTTVSCPAPNAGMRASGPFTATDFELWGFGDSSDIWVYRKRP